MLGGSNSEAGVAAIMTHVRNFLIASILGDAQLQERPAEEEHTLLGDATGEDL